MPIEKALRKEGVVTEAFTQRYVSSAA